MIDFYYIISVMVDKRMKIDAAVLDISLCFLLLLPHPAAILPQ